MEPVRILTIFWRFLIILLHESTYHRLHIGTGACEDSGQEYAFTAYYVQSLFIILSIFVGLTRQNRACVHEKTNWEKMA